LAIGDFGWKLLSVEAKMSALEKKVDAMSKAFYLILFEKAEAFPKEEVEELKKRLNAYLQGRRDEFVSIDEMLS
jgi:hypothetical protein